MKKAVGIRHGALALLLATGIVGAACTSHGVVGIVVGDGGGEQPTCGLTGRAFCAVFAQPEGGGGRGGALGGVLFAVSRTSSNVAQAGAANGWAPATQLYCGQERIVTPPDDVALCDGRIVEAQDDRGAVTALAMRPTQPFDIEGRTGTIVFDVSNNTRGGHAAWPEVWFTDQPIPAPFMFQTSWRAYPRNGIAIRFQSHCPANAGCPNCAPSPIDRSGASSIVVVTNYVAEDSDDGAASIHPTFPECVAASHGPTELNHYEIRLSRSRVEVFGTAPNTTSPLVLLMAADIALPFSRGYVTLEDAHNNGDKFDGQAKNTFAWDSFGFDGPILPRDRTYGALDRSSQGSDGTIDLGWHVDSTPFAITIDGVDARARAKSALVTFSAHFLFGPGPVSIAVNGHAARAVPYPFTDGTLNTWRPMVLEVPLDEIVDGRNELSFSAPDMFTLANVDLTLVGAGE